TRRPPTAGMERAARRPRAARWALGEAANAGRVVRAWIRFAERLRHRARQKPAPALPDGLEIRRALAAAPQAGRHPVPLGRGGPWRPGPAPFAGAWRRLPRRRVP